MSSIKYNFYKTHEFLPETSSDEIEPTINANKFGQLTQDRKVINISLRVKDVVSSHHSKNGHHKNEINHSLKRRSSSILMNNHEKYFNLNGDDTQTDPNLLIKLEQKNGNTSSSSSNVFHKNAICVLFIEDSQGRREYARTEVIWNQDEPNWVKNITLEIFPQMNELLSFEIYEIISNNRNIEHQKLLALTSIELSSLIQSLNNYVQLPLSIAGTNETSGYLELNFYELKLDVEGSYIFLFRVDDFHSPTRIIKNPRPYFIIERLNESNNQYVNVYKSEVIKHLKSKSAEWSYVQLNLQAICGGDIDLPLRITLYDYLSTKHTDNKNGFIDTSLRRLIETKDFQFIDSNGKGTAHLHSELISKIEKPSFFDFKLKGLKIQPILGIDFSCTKINYVDSNRLLHFDNGQFSYIAAITEVYDSVYELVKDQSFISYAFADFKGTKVIPLFCENMKENKAIQMKINQSKNVCCSYTPKNFMMMPTQERNSERKSYHSSIKSIVESYDYTKHHITYPEHSLLEPLINKALKDAQNRYEVDGTISLLIILSNGVFSDLNKAINRLVDADGAPLITLFVLMDGMRNDIYDSIVQKKGKLVNSIGQKSKRKLAEVVIYSDGNMFCDQRLDTEIVPSIENMATEFLRSH